MSLCALVHWEDPISSGSVFGSVLVALVSICYYSLISVIAYLSLGLLSIVLGVKLYSYVMVMMKKAEPGSNPLSRIAAMEVTIPSDKVSELSTGLAEKLNCGLGELRRLFLVDNMVDTVKFGLSLWCLTYIGSGETLVQTWLGTCWQFCLD
jgi:hypothetical protein